MIGAYTKAPPMAWSGWRLRIPGGPEGGQYHGFIAADSLGWRGLPGGPPPATPPAPWDDVWGGTALAEGENRSDYVYRSSAEIRARANAFGRPNVLQALQTRRTAGYAVAPGNYKGLGSFGVVACPQISFPACPSGSYRPAGGPPCYTPGATCVVSQPPPTSYPQPSPVVGAPCPAGETPDAAGYCSADERNPYSLYLPVSPAPAPTVAMPTTCPATSPYPDGYGNCFPSAAAAQASAAALAAGGSGITGWLSQSTLIPGVENLWIALGGGLAAVLLLRGRR